MRYPRQYGGFPKHKSVKLKWGYTWPSCACGPTATIDWVFTPMGLWDPFVGSQQGIQPRYLDQYLGANQGVGLYNNYVVHGAKFTQVIENLTSVPLQGAVTNWAQPITENRPSSYAEALSRGDCKTFLVGPVGGVYGRQKLEYYVNNHKLVTKKNLIDDDTCWGSASSNPAHNSYSSLRMWNVYGAAATCTVTTTIVFYVTFFNLNDVSDSSLGVDDSDVPYDGDDALDTVSGAVLQPSQELTRAPVSAPTVTFPSTDIPVDVIKLGSVVLP